MNNDLKADLELHEGGDQRPGAIREQAPLDVHTATSSQSVLQSNAEILGANRGAFENNHVNLIDRSDSEAETVVLNGKQEAPNEPMGKAIKNEDPSDSDGHPSPRSNGFHAVPETEKRNDNDIDRPSLKRKRTTKEHNAENAPSSNLSSAVSSPGARAHSPQASSSGLQSTRPTPTTDEGIERKHAESRKRKVAPSVDDQNRKKRGKSDPNSVPVHRKERHEPQLATHHEVPRRRSDSPPSQRHKRAQSTQLVDLPYKNRRRKAPPPKLVENRRKASEDVHGESDDSSSVNSHPHLQKVASVDHSVMSPAKFSHKKNRDRNGRTLLARACASDFAEVQRLLKERPEDINVPDNAGNTPLQIASLEGLADVVQLLLDARCDTTCKNIDLDTPLIDAVENGHLEVVRLLLDAGLDPYQCNAKGEEPLDLVSPDDDDYDEIRAALMAAKERHVLRRPSGDHTAHDRDNDLSSMGPSAASPTNDQAGKSPPPPGLGPRRRTARSQPTQDKLLWVNPTPAKLREACERGDMTVVGHILKMCQEVGTDAVIAAARGGHDEILGILLAVGTIEHDPDPIESSDFKPGRNTPILAAIGRGHIPVIKLLVNQSDFNPTRRIFQGITYHELAEKRQGSNWEEEYIVLKQAYDDYQKHGNRRSTQNSPRKARSRRPEAGRPTSTSPSLVNRRLPSSSSVKTAPEPETRREHSQKAPSNKHLSISEESKDSAVLSDRDSESSGPPEPRPKAARSISEASHVSLKHPDATKPRRKLISRNEFKSDQDAKRRASLAHNTSSHEPPTNQPDNSTPLEQGKHERKLSESSISVPKVRQGSSKDLHSSKIEPGKKRPRVSTSPTLRGSYNERSKDVFVNKKKRRVDSEGNAIVQDPQYNENPISTGRAMVANMIASPEQVTSPSEPPSRAPVANMGVSSASPVTKSPTEPATRSEVHSPMSGIQQTLQQGARQPKPQEQAMKDPPIPLRYDEDLQRQTEDDIEGQKQRAAELERARFLEKKRHGWRGLHKKSKPDSNSSGGLKKLSGRLG